MIRAIWCWLLRGSDDLIMPRTWLRDPVRLREYEAYTVRQLDQGAVLKDVAATRRAAFWVAQDAKRRPSSLKYPRAV